MKNKIVILVLSGFLTISLVTTRVVQARSTTSFEDLWSQIKANSPVLKQAQQEFDASKIARDRSKRNYLPTATIQAKGINTNDAGLTLFSNLGERAVTAADFNPADLNDPGYANFVKGSVLLNLPLYQGGMNTAQKKASASMSLAKDYGNRFAGNFEFANTATEYALLLTAIGHKNNMTNLSVVLNQFLKEYELDSTKNPVGYSGVLGLKALANRLKGAVKQSQAEINSYKISLSRRSGLDANSWTPRQQNVLSFLTKHFGKITHNASVKKVPASVKASQYAAQAMNDYAAVEKSYLLPHVGVFGQADLNVGSRDAATATTLGGYLNWNILSPTQYGSHKEKKLLAKAMQSQTDALALKSTIDYEQSLQSVVVNRENLALMRESLALLVEQSGMAKELYLNGAINILHVADLLNRRADLVMQIHQVQTQLCLDYAKNYLQGGLGE